MIGFETNAGGQQELLFVSLPQGLKAKSLTVKQVIAQPKLLDDIIAKTPATKIPQANGHAISMVVKQILKILACPLVDYEHGLAFALLLFLLVGEFTLFDLNMVFVSEPTQSLRICHLLMFHDKIDRRSTLATAETVARATSRRNKKRWCFLIVKRAKPLVVGPRLLERNEL